MSLIQLAMSEAVKQPAESEPQAEPEAPSGGKAAAEVSTGSQAAADIRKDDDIVTKVHKRRSACCISRRLSYAESFEGRPRCSYARFMNSSPPTAD